MARNDVMFGSHPGCRVEERVKAVVRQHELERVVAVDTGLRSRVDDQVLKKKDDEEINDDPDSSIQRLLPFAVHVYTHVYTHAYTLGSCC